MHAAHLGELLREHAHVVRAPDVWYDKQMLDPNQVQGVHLAHTSTNALRVGSAVAYQLVHPVRGVDGDQNCADTGTSPL